MKKSTVPQSLKTLKRWFEGGTLNLNHPIQRAAAQWNSLQQSLLIHSILSDYIVPPIYLIKEKQGKSTMYHLIEGKQRISSLFSYINDEFALHPKVPAIMFEGKSYDLAEKKFSELDDVLREEILGFFFTIYQLEDATEEEIEESFARLNSGTALSKIQLARPKMGSKLAKWTGELLSTSFFQKALNLTVAQLRREDDFLCLMQIMMLIDGFNVKTMVSAAECVRFAESIRNNFSEEKMRNIETLVGYLNEAFTEADYKYLRKNNIVIVGYVADIARRHDIPAKDYEEFVSFFFESGETETYKEASGSGNNKLGKVNTRIKELFGALMSAYPKYFEDDNEIPSDFIKKVESSSSNGVQDSLPNQENETPSEETTSLDPQDNIVPIPVVVENSEDNTEEPSPIEESGDNVENTEDLEGEESEGEESEGEDFEGEESEGEESEGEDSEGEDFETEDFSLEDTLECVSETEDTGEEHSNTGKE